MNIVIVGTGSLGILFGGLLLKSGQNVFFLDREREKIEHIRKHGLSIFNKNSWSTDKVLIGDSVAGLPAIDLFLICVKSPSTKEAAQLIQASIGNSTLVLTLQNGIGNIEVLSELLGEEHVIGGVTNHGAHMLEWGKVKHAGAGETIIGAPDGRDCAQLRTIRELFNKAGIKTRLTKDIKSILWSKLIINVGINALTAITRLPNGKLLDYEGTRLILREAVTEAVKIAKRKRIKLLYDDPAEKTVAVCQSTADNASSMLQDILNKRKTEIEFINGAIVRQGKSLGISTPYNEMLVHLVKTLEASTSFSVEPFAKKEEG